MALKAVTRKDWASVTVDGVVSGEIDGKLVWANYPRRRQDGVWTPNLRGVITAADGDELLVSIHGQSVEEDASCHRARDPRACRADDRSRAVSLAEYVLPCR